MYYTEFDWLPEDQIEEIFPEYGLPQGTRIEPYDDTDDAPAFTNTEFHDWIWEGRHDCDVGFALLRMWCTAMRGSGTETVADFFISLLHEYNDQLQSAAPSDFEPVATLPVSFLATLLQRYEHVPFDTAGQSPEEVHLALTTAILEEKAMVGAYTTTWRGTTVVQEPEQHRVADAVHDVCTDIVHPWPTIDRDPVPLYEEGRFVNAHPPDFPMGVGDLHQPRLRDDFSTADWAQHKFQHFDGRFLPAQSG